MDLVVLVIIVICFVKCLLAANMTGFIVGGHYAHIKQFPYSVAITINCGMLGTGACGSSVLNQAILLTAAHCFDKCANPVVLAYAGHAFRWKGMVTPVSKFVTHEDYDVKTLVNDVAVLRLKKELKLDDNICRVILMREPPYDHADAFIAGWGYVKPGGPASDYLKDISQKVYKREDCYKIGLKRLPIGTICGEEKHKHGNPDNGDSGGALVVHNNTVQIGIVSFARLAVSATNTIYTDTGFFYDWIIENSLMLHCSNY